MDCCLPTWVVDRARLVGKGVHMCTQEHPSWKERARGAPDGSGASSLHVASFQSGNSRTLKNPNLNSFFQVITKVYL